MYKKTLLVLLLTFSFLSATVRTIWANEQFDTKYDVTYDVDVKGKTNITQNVTIINKVKEVFASNYFITIKQMNIFDIQAKDKIGKMDVEVSQEGNETTIKSILNNQVIGEDRQNNFQIMYSTNDVANKVGEIWNIQIPKIDGLEATSDYKVTLKIPVEFGPKIYISPTPLEEYIEQNKTVFVFNKQELFDSGVNAAFGNYQVLNFKLKYQLKNDQKVIAYQQIALPPEIVGRQQVAYKTLAPKPEFAQKDKDGNLMATYKLQPNEILNIELFGTVKLLNKQIQPEFGGKFENIPSNLTKNYTIPQKYWESDAADIQAIAQQLKNPNETVSQNALNIYKYITQNVSYNFELNQNEYIDRKGALAVITKNEPAACMEFTDLFIAIARAMGIPARELNGYAFASNDTNTPVAINFRGGDLLHSWPEYYDPIFGWTAIDPTWGTTSGIEYFTKLDTNHFVFVVKGTNSELPLPAGAYKITDEDKQVDVEFAVDYDKSIFEPNIYGYQATNYNPIMLLRGQKRILIENQNGNYLNNINNSKKDLHPYGWQIIYLPTTQTTISYEDFTGVTKTTFVKMQQKTPIYYKQDRWIISIAFLVALVLCGMTYVLIIHPRDPKKQLRRLYHHLRDQGQPPNQNLQ